jgi:PAS domain S-box-containing protein
VELSDEDVVSFLGLSTELFGAFCADGRIVWANAGMASALGYGEQELQHMGLDQLIHPDDRAAVTAMFTSGSTDGDGSTPGAETRWRRKDGTWRWLEWTARPPPGT